MKLHHWLHHCVNIALIILLINISLRKLTKFSDVQRGPRPEAPLLEKAISLGWYTLLLMSPIVPQPLSFDTISLDAWGHWRIVRTSWSVQYEWKCRFCCLSRYSLSLEGLLEQTWYFCSSDNEVGEGTVPKSWGPRPPTDVDTSEVTGSVSAWLAWTELEIKN